MYLQGNGLNDHIEAAVRLRHELHRKPELTWQEHATAAAIREILSELGIAWRVCADTGTVATLAPAATGKHIALRADIDALPIEERLAVPWRSQVPNCMHACGHDGHTAALMATASWLKQHEELLPGPVTLLFQPAEEGGHGARAMIQDGALQGYGSRGPVEEIYGWHNWPAIPFGKAVCPDGPVMAANGTFVIEVQGVGGHSSQPELCRDPLLAAAAIIQNLQQIVSRCTAPQQSAVVSVTSCDAPSMPTVIRDNVRLEGSIRIADTAQREAVFSHITTIAEQTALAFGATALVKNTARYNATVNHADAADRCRQVLWARMGNLWNDAGIAVPIMASEDFSYYLEQIPGAFMLIGASQDGRCTAACHNPAYEFNDNLIPVVQGIYCRLAAKNLPIA